MHHNDNYDASYFTYVALLPTKLDLVKFHMVHMASLWQRCLTADAGETRQVSEAHLSASLV